MPNVNSPYRGGQAHARLMECLVQGQILSVERAARTIARRTLYEWRTLGDSDKVKIRRRARNCLEALEDLGVCSYERVELDGDVVRVWQYLCAACYDALDPPVEQQSAGAG